MNIERERHLLALIERVVDLEPTARQRFLLEACGDDRELLEEARAALTERYGALEDFLAEPAWSELTTVGGALSDAGSPGLSGAEPASPGPPGSAASGRDASRVRVDPDAPTLAIPAAPLAIGPYRLLDKLGEGGMGRVFLAEQEKPLRRRVALKLMRSSLIGRDARARFDAERQALARLSHPNVGAIFDAGTTHDGVPFFAMELVEGESLIRYCDRRRLGIGARLRVFVDVCHGVEHAHRKQVLHRDLKPSNILVVEVDGKPVPKIIDFGIAKALDQPLTDATLATLGGMVGTPHYMSPEALDGSDDLDTRADVYSLGVLLYELLAGVRPFDAGKESVGKLMRRIRREDSPRPSTRWTGLDGAVRARAAARRGISAGELHRRLKNELDWIVLRAIAKEREERYGSATELANDLERHLRHEPVTARPPSFGYLATRWIRRYRVPVAAGVLLVASLTAGVVARGIEAERANRAAAAAKAALEESVAARAEAEETVQLLIGLFQQASPDHHQGREVTALEALEKALDVLPESFPDRPLSRARFMDQLASIFSQLGRLDVAERLAFDTLELRRAHLAEDHPDVAHSLAQVGYVKERQGQLAVAEDYYRRALEIGEKVLPPDDDLLALVSGNLAILLSRAGSYSEAEPFYRRALAIREANLGGDHVRIGFPALNLGLNYALQDRVDEAEVLIRRAYDLFLADYGVENPYTLAAMAALARIRVDRGDAQAGEEMTRDVLAKQEALFGADHPQVAEVVHQLAAIVEERRPGADEAAALYLRAIEIREKSHGPDSADLAASLVGLAGNRRVQGHAAEAERLLRRAVDVYGRVLPEEHPDRIAAEAALAEIRAGASSGGNRPPPEASRG